ncbi:MAG: hypothetical protein P8Z75_01030 [Gammaproteobacteria bacterium]
MINKRTLLSLAVAAGLGAASLQANAAAPTVYGDLSFALVYTGAPVDGGDSSYALSDNVSLLGVKGEAAKIGNTSYYYDFNWILDGGSPATHLAVVGAKGGMGDLSVGTRVNGLFVGMVDGGTYMTNWYYTPGMSALQVSNAITYTGGSGPVSFGVQAFDITKGSDNTTNYTVAGTYATGGLKFGLGYTSYSDYAVIDSNGTIAQYGFSTDTNQFAESTNSYDGVTLKSVTGISAAYTADKYSVTAAYDVRKPTDNYNADDIKTAMLTGTYSVSPKTTLAANYSNTSGATKGSIITAMVSYAPSDALLYTFEIQNSDEKAVTNGLTGATAVGTKSVTGFAAGVIYNF